MPAFGTGPFGSGEFGIGSGLSAPLHPFYPQYTVEIAFTSSTSGFWTLDTSGLDTGAVLGAGYASAVFQQMTGVRSITTTRGRQQENAVIQTGMATVTLDNADGRFSPDNNASPYAPNVISGRLIRISAVYWGVTYPMFTGYIESIQPVDNGEMDSDVIITAHDWLGKANKAVINSTFPNQDEGQRIDAAMNLLNDDGFPRVLDIGPDTLVAQSFGSAVGLAQGPLVKPTLVASGSGSALLAGTHAVSYSWLNTAGQETITSPAENIIVTAGQNIVVTLPMLPVDYMATRVYLSLSANSSLMGFQVQVSGTSQTLAAYPAAFAVPPPVTQGTLINVQQHINDVLAAERGLFYPAADGSYHYENRHYRIVTPRSTTVQASFGQPDAITNRMPVGVLPYTQMEYVFDDRDIYNEIRVNASSTFEGEQVATDSASITLHDTRTLSVQSQCMGVGVAANLAQWLLQGYKDQHARIPALHLDGDSSDGSGTASDMWVQILSREISDRIHVSKLRPGSMHVDQDVWIEGISHTVLVDLGGHQTTWQLGAVSAYGPAGTWILGTSGLDATAVLGTF